MTPAAVTLRKIIPLLSKILLTPRVFRLIYSTASKAMVWPGPFERYELSARSAQGE